MHRSASNNRRCCGTGRSTGLTRALGWPASGPFTRARFFSRVHAPWARAAAAARGVADPAICQLTDPLAVAKPISKTWWSIDTAALLTITVATARAALSNNP